MNIKISKLSKYFDTPVGAKTVLDALSLEVGHGEVFALMGANGSGKTTLLKIISTLVLPSSGEVLADGMNVAAYPARARKMIGLVHGADGSFYQMLTAEENLKFFSRLRGPVRQGQINSLLKELGLEGLASTRFSHLSSGMKQRLALARAMLGSPGILLIDEVSRSLDEDSLSRVSHLIKKYAEDNKAACIVVTHDASWPAKYAHRSGVLAGGRIERVQ